MEAHRQPENSGSSEWNSWRPTEETPDSHGMALPSQLFANTFPPSSPPFSSIVDDAAQTKYSCKQEDEQLLILVETNGTESWSVISKDLKGRTGKQCRERWSRNLCPEIIKKTDWTSQEDEIIFSMHRQIGCKWATISKLLPGRSDNAVKNRFHSTMRRYRRAESKAKVRKSLQMYKFRYQVLFLLLVRKTNFRS